MNPLKNWKEKLILLLTTFSIGNSQIDISGGGNFRVGYFDGTGKYHNVGYNQDNNFVSLVKSPWLISYFSTSLFASFRYFSTEALVIVWMRLLPHTHRCNSGILLKLLPHSVHLKL